MGLKLHGLPMSTNTARVIAVLNEKAVDFELVIVDLRVGAHKQPTFLALNPFGQIPVLEDGDLVFFESRAINRYLANKYKDSGDDLLLQGTLSESAQVDLWVEVESKHFDAAVAPLVKELVIKPVFGGSTDPEAVEVHAAALGKVLDVYEEHLGKHKYLAGERYSLADLHHQPYIHYLLTTPKADLVTSRPKVLAWWKEISARPAWIKTSQAMKFA